jgi:hypothetical protein
MSNFNEIARKTDFLRGKFESENNLETYLEKKIHLLQILLQGFILATVF